MCTENSVSTGIPRSEISRNVGDRNAKIQSYIHLLYITPIFCGLLLPVILGAWDQTSSYGLCGYWHTCAHTYIKITNFLKFTFSTRKCWVRTDMLIYMNTHNNLRNVTWCFIFMMNTSVCSFIFIQYKALIVLVLIHTHKLQVRLKDMLTVKCLHTQEVQWKCI